MLTLFCILIKLSTQISGFAMYGKISYDLTLISTHSVVDSTLEIPTVFINSFQLIGAYNQLHYYDNCLTNMIITR